MEIRRLPASPPLPLRSTRFGDSKLSCPHPTRPPSLGAETQLAKSLLPLWQAGFLSLREEKEGGGKRPAIRKQVEKQVV